MGCHKNADLPRRPKDCRRLEAHTLTKYLAGKSSGAAANKLSSENTTGHDLQVAAAGILLRTYLPSSGPVCVCRSTRPLNASPYRVR